MSPGSQGGVKKNLNLSTSIRCSVQSLQQARVMDCHSSGNKLLTPSPDPFPVWRCVQSRGEMESVCSMLLRHVFPNTPTTTLPPSPFFSPLVKSCSRWGDRAQRAATGSPGNLCPLSKNMFWPSAPHLEAYSLGKAILLGSRMTQYAWRVLFWHPEIAKQL